MHTDDSRLSDLERRAWRYDTQDGILELLAGLLFLCIGGAVSTPRLAWLPALFVFPFRFLHRILKQRYAYPRVGYVKLRSEDGRRLGRGMLTYLAGVVAVAAICLWILGDVNDPMRWKQWLPALAGGFTSGGFLFLARKTGIWRFWALAAVSCGWGIAVAVWLEVPGYLGIQRWAVGLGALCLIFGVVSFIRFLRTHQVHEAEILDEPV